MQRNTSPRNRKQNISKAERLDLAQFDPHCLTQAADVLYKSCMTELVSFRPCRPKRELKQAFGNVSRKLNELIEREMAGNRPADWRDVLKRDRPFVSDEEYGKCLRPE
jgi:hypothetical protein